MQPELAVVGGVAGAIIGAAAADAHERYVPGWMALGYVLPAIYMFAGELLWRLL